MENPDLKNYMKAMNSKKLNEIKLIPSKRKVALTNQNNKCNRSYTSGYLIKSKDKTS